MKLCTKDEVAHQLKSSKRTIDNWVASGAMPKPIHIGRRALWAQEIIDLWLAEKAASQFVQNPPPVRRGRPRKYPSAVKLMRDNSKGGQS